MALMKTIIMDKTGIHKINEICKSVLKLTDSDFSEIELLIEEQSTFTHPLKRGRAKIPHDLSDQNKRALECLKNLQKAVKSGAGI